MARRSSKNIHIEMSVDEIVSTINRSDSFTVLVEGRDDMLVFRRIEHLLKSDYASLLVVGGKENLLSVVDKLVGMGCRKFVAIADMDLWAYTGIPSKYISDAIITTQGYSIENDVICDLDPTKMMEDSERSRFQCEVEQFSLYFAYQIERALRKKSAVWKMHPDHFFAGPEIFYSHRKKCIQKLQTYKKIAQNSARLLRGKSLLFLLIRQLSYQGRAPRHRHDALLEFSNCVEGQNISRIVESVNVALARHLITYKIIRENERSI